MKNEVTRERGSGRTVCALSVLPTLTVVIFLVVWRPLLLPYFFRYAQSVISECINDKQRFQENELLVAQKEWRMYKIESRYGQDLCKENMKLRSLESLELCHMLIVVKSYTNRSDAFEWSNGQD